MVSDVPVINGESCIQQDKLLLCKVSWKDKGRSKEKAIYGQMKGEIESRTQPYHLPEERGKLA